MAVFLRPSRMVFQRDYLRGLVDDLVEAEGAGATMDGLVAFPYTNEIDPDEDVLIGDFTIADHDSAGVAVEWGVGTNAGNGSASHWQYNIIAGASPTQENLNGLVLRNGASGPVAAVVPFDVPVPIVNEGDYGSIDVVAKIPYIWETDLAV